MSHPFIPTMGHSKAQAMQQNYIRCSAMLFQHVENLVPNFGISQVFIVRFSDGVHHDIDNGHYNKLSCDM